MIRSRICTIVQNQEMNIEVLTEFVILYFIIKELKKRN